jgi:Protein kinase domain
MADSASLIGQKLSHYRILDKLGEDGMGAVYRAYDEQLHRDVALKVLPVGLLRDQTARARLRREAQTAAALNHPNVCGVYEVAEADGVLYIAMEFVSGRTLRVVESFLALETMVVSFRSSAGYPAARCDSRIPSILQPLAVDPVDPLWQPQWQRHPGDCRRIVPGREDTSRNIRCS